MGTASILGSYVYKASYNDLPQNVVTGTKERIIDFLATAFDSYYRAPMEPVTTFWGRSLYDALYT